MLLKCICEVCGTDAVLTSEAAYESGWDYPPRMCQFGVIGPRSCPDCPITGTVWWALAMERYTMDMLNSQQVATVERIMGEPQSIVVR